MSTPKFRVTDKTPREFPNCHQFFVEELVHGAWRLVIFDAMWVCFADRAKADTVAGKLTRGESIADDMKRVPNRFWDREGYDPSQPLTRR